MIGLVIQMFVMITGLLLAREWAARFEERQRLELEHLADQIRRMLPPPSSTENITYEEPPQLELSEPPAPLPVARALKP